MARLPSEEACWVTGLVGMDVKLEDTQADDLVEDQVRDTGPDR